MLPAALVTKEMVPKMRFVPLLSRMAAPRPVSTSSGSAQESVVRIRMNSTYTTAMAAIFATSVTVELVATAVETAAPSSALPSSISSRTAATASRRFSSSTVTVNRAQPSL